MLVSVVSLLCFNFFITFGYKVEKYNQKKVALTHYKADVSVLTRGAYTVKKRFLRYRFFQLVINFIHKVKCIK